MENVIRQVLMNAEKDGVEVNLSKDESQLDFHASISLRQCKAMYSILRHRGNKELISFNPSIDTKNITDNTFLYLLFHELGHATGAVSRLKRERLLNLSLLIPSNSVIVYKEEIIAERIAQKCLAYLGVDCSKVRNTTILYIIAYLNELESDINDSEAYQIELDAEAGFQYIVSNWMHNKEFSKSA